MSWQLQEAKQKFSELVQRALDEGPQSVTRRGEKVVVVVSAREFERLSRPVADFREFLLSFPDSEDFQIERSREVARAVDL